MRYVAAYLLAALGGNGNPEAADIKKILESVGIEADDTRLSKVVSELSGKNVNDVIATGYGKLASVPAGGAVAVASSAAVSSGGAAAPAAVEEKKEEKKEESEIYLVEGFNKCLKYQFKIIEHTILLRKNTPFTYNQCDQLPFDCLI